MLTFHLTNYVRTTHHVLLLLHPGAPATQIVTIIVELDEFALAGLQKSYLLDTLYLHWRSPVES